MNWEKIDFYTENYYADVAKAIASNAFINEDSNQPDYVQYGIGVIERADMAIRDSENKNIITSALKCLLTFFEKEPEYFALHLNRTIGTFTYSGILNTTIEDVKSFWYLIAENTQNSSHELYKWLSLLAVAAFKDTKMSEKFQLINDLLMDEYESSEILKQLRENYDDIEESVPPEYFICKLGLL
ncbi:MAG: hypothetical protein JO149_06055 [Gammaproteobacteria bacterium]|nr:hypothetical protein [Gammaproteobacteria bacterium]